jgi:hypothetical protein
LRSSSDKKDYWVAFSEDKEFIKFKKKLEAYSSQDKKNFFTAIDKIGTIPTRDKIGDLLRKRPLRENEFAYLDVEIWRMEDHSLEKFLNSLDKFLMDQGGRLVDKMVTNNYCMLRVQSNKKLSEDILELPDVARLDRPPEVEIADAIDVDLEKFEPIESPSNTAHGILVLDSGVRRHPLLENAIKDEIYLPVPSGKISSVHDDVGHGTQVAGVALYGDIYQCIKDRNFLPEAWIYSAKVLYKDSNGNACGDPERLLHNQLRDAIEKIIKNNPNCKVINISFANIHERMTDGQMQFNLAALLDELCEEYAIIVVVSVGNYHEGETNYPNYLTSSSNKAKIANPSTSALAISVGSIYRKQVGNGDSLDLPSPFTRLGPGFKRMIKPEIVEYGGANKSEGIVTINPDWVNEGKLFRTLSGTSLSTPRVSNHLVKILNRYPSYSPNLVKALLLSSTTIPDERPGALDNVKMSDNENKVMKVYNVYGYGKPDIENALYSSNNRVLLIKDDIIKINHIRLFSLTLPEDFVNEAGNRRISISLSFNPPVNKNRASYLGVVMEVHLFKNASTDEIKSAYGQLKINNLTESSESEPLVPRKIKNLEINLRPGSNIRKRGVHQKGIVSYVKKPRISADKPLTLAVICRNRGWVDKDYEQSYGVVVKIEHSKEIDLYNELRIKNLQRARIR